MKIANILDKHARILFTGFAFAAVSLTALGQQRIVSPTPLESTSAQQMTKAAVAFLSSLSELQRENIVYEFNQENRTN